MFHRLSLPTYYRPSGDLLSGYDLLNTPGHSSVGGTGAPALVSARKVGGVNDGTYFCAFHEDGLSQYVNRPAYALGENTDVLDNITRESLPRLTSVDYVVGTAPATTSTVQLSGAVFVGVAGTPNTQAGRDQLVHITDTNDHELEVGGAKVQVTLIHDGLSVNVVGQASGFYTAPTLTFSPALPAATAFRVHFGERTNYADVSLTNKGHFFGPQAKFASRMSADVRAMLRTLHASSGQNWNSGWDSTIQALAAAGLNERYNRATGVPGSYTFNAPGNGRVIRRTGGAVEVRGPTGVMTPAAAWPDPLFALMRLSSESYGTGSPALDEYPDYGVVRETPYRTVVDPSNEVVDKSRPGPMLLELIPRDVRATVSGSAAYTYCPAGAPALGNPGGGAADNTVLLNAPYYFRDGSGKTAIRCGVDLLEVTFLDGRVKTYVIDGFDDDVTTAVQLVHLNGASLSSEFAPGELLTVRWLAPSVSIGGAQADAAGGFNQLSSFMFLMPRKLSAGVSEPMAQPARFAKGDFTAANKLLSGYLGQDGQTLEVGYYDDEGSFVTRFGIYADGTTHASGGRQTATVVARAAGSALLTASPANLLWSVDALSFLSLRHQSTANVVTLDFEPTQEYEPRSGDTLNVMFHRHSSSTLPCVITWPTNFSFSGSDGDLSTVPVNGSVKFTFVYDSYKSKFFATRTDY